jgi:soluble lytic murein transglycosylase-like protein
MVLARNLRPAVILAAFCAPVFAGEYAVLTNGFRLYVDRHETKGAVVRLYSSSGVTEMNASRIASFERDDYVAPAPPSTLKTPPPSPQQLVTEAAIRNGLPPAFVHSVAAAESGYRADAVSSKGAIGLMQLMPDTAKQLKADPNDPKQNAEAGAKYLRELLLKYKDDPYQVRKALAGYNAGPAAVDRYNGIPPYRETQQYIEKVLRRYQGQTSACPKSTCPQ